MKGKKNGSRSKKCTLPSDRLTPAQKRRLNGPVSTYNLSKPMNWIEFIQMPKDIQLEYLNTLVTNLKARRVDLCLMFGVSPATFDKYRKEKLGWSYQFPLSAAKSLSYEWQCFRGTDAPEFAEDTTPAEEKNVEPAQNTGVKQAPVKLSCNSGKLRYSGDPHLIFQKALNALDLSKEYNICIIFTESGGGQT